MVLRRQNATRLRPRAILPGNFPSNRKSRGKVAICVRNPARRGTGAPSPPEKLSDGDSEEESRGTRGSWPLRSQLTARRSAHQAQRRAGGHSEQPKRRSAPSVASGAVRYRDLGRRCCLMPAVAFISKSSCFSNRTRGTPPEEDRVFSHTATFARFHQNLSTGWNSGVNPRGRA
jgi:hypothetical protein